jgi:asparagine synthase (glutamine-hydrolysing)
MCGITGKVDFSGAIVDRALIETMCATIAHRGPDDERVWTAPYVGLGQRRLAIIDLDHRGAAPLSNEDGSVWVTFNGEIYNFLELRAELESKGHTFRTNTDTEVIVHLYEEHGVDCVQRMRGMFAFAVWDANAKRLFAARDRLGKKPFVYTRTPNAFIFGSEIKAVTADPSVTIAPNYRAIDEYLTLQYVPSPLTAFEGIEKLPAAHWLICDATTRDVRIERYWEAPSREKTRASEEEIGDELVHRLRECVRMRLMSDVPLGAFLSGGIDSAAVVALMAQESGSRVKTFSIGFEEQEFNELPYARLIADRYDTEHHELIVKTDAAAVLPLLVHHYNEPFADSSALPTYYVSKLTREHVTVALSGDGGDENFAGYNNYGAVMSWSKADAIPSPLRNITGRTMSAVLDALPHGTQTARASRAFTMLAGDLPERFRMQTAILKPREKANGYSDRFRALAGDSRSPVGIEWNEEMDALDWMMRHDQSFYLTDCLNVKVDIASMANSLEVRSPLLDHTFMEFTATIPSAMKRDAGGGKQIFKRAVRQLLPDEILTKRKTGFGLPIGAWFRGPLQPMLRETLQGDVAKKRDLFKPAFVAQMIDEHVAGRHDRGARLWALLFLELWFREFID